MEFIEEDNEYYGDFKVDMTPEKTEWSRLQGRRIHWMLTELAWLLDCLEIALRIEEVEDLLHPLKNKCMLWQHSEDQMWKHYGLVLSQKDHNQIMHTLNRNGKGKARATAMEGSGSESGSLSGKIQRKMTKRIIPIETERKAKGIIQKVADRINKSRQMKADRERI